VAERESMMHDNTSGDIPRLEFTITDYADYKDGTNFIDWLNDTWDTMEAHGLGEISNPWYTPDPNNPDEVWEFRKKQAKMFFVLSKKSKQYQGKRSYRRTCTHEMHS
jgi:hypothetical protein